MLLQCNRYGPAHTDSGCQALRSQSVIQGIREAVVQIPRWRYFGRTAQGMYNPAAHIIRLFVHLCMGVGRGVCGRWCLIDC